MDTKVTEQHKPACLSSTSTSDEEWIDKYEQEIDRQVDSIFQMAENLNESNQERNYSPFEDLELMTNLNQGLSRKKQRYKLSSILLLITVVLVVIAVVERFLISGVWIREEFCKTMMNEPLCHQCYGPWNVYKGPHSMERFLELHRKIKSKLCKEICCHTLAVIVFSGLFIMSVVELLKDRDSDTRKWTAATLGICHFGLFATAILHLKYNGVMELNPLKCKISIYLEIYNIAATTAFIVLATRHILPPPFHQWTGTALLLIIYWLPLIMYKTSQVCRMLEFISILNYLQQCSVKYVRKPCCTRNQDAIQHNITRPTTSASISNVSSSMPILSAAKPLSASSPHIPYEWALIDSFSSALP